MVASTFLGRKAAQRTSESEVSRSERLFEALPCKTWISSKSTTRLAAAFSYVWVSHSEKSVRVSSNVRFFGSGNTSQLSPSFSIVAIKKLASCWDEWRSSKGEVEIAKFVETVLAVGDDCCRSQRL